MITYTLYFIIGLLFAYWYDKKYIKSWITKKGLNSDTRVVIFCVVCSFWILFAAFILIKKFLTKFNA